jgi:hypothetical protein
VPDRPAGDVPELPPDVPPEYAEAYLRGFQRAYSEAASLAPGTSASGATAEQDEWQPDVLPVPPDPGEPPPPPEPPEPWQYEPPEQRAQWEYEPPPPTWEFESPGAAAEQATEEWRRGWRAEDDEAPEDPRPDESGDDGEGRAALRDDDTAEQDRVDPDDAAEPGFVLWEGHDDDYDDAPDVAGYPRWVMPFLALCLIVLLCVAILALS